MKGTTQPRQDAPTATSSAQHLRRRRNRQAEQRRYTALVVAGALLSAAAAMAVDGLNLDPVASGVQRALQEAQQTYAHWRAQVARYVAAAPTQEPAARPGPAAQSTAATPALGPRIVIAPPFGYGPSLYAALPLVSGGAALHATAATTAPTLSIPVQTGASSVAVGEDGSGRARTPARWKASSPRRADLAGFEPNTRPSAPAELMQATTADVWTAPLDAYDRFASAALSNPFAPHPPRPLVPEPTDRSLAQTPNDEAAADSSQPPPASSRSASAAPDDATSSAKRADSTAPPDTTATAQDGAAADKPTFDPVLADTSRGKSDVLSVPPESVAATLQSAVEAASPGPSERARIDNQHPPQIETPVVATPGIDPASKPDTMPVVDLVDKTRTDIELPAPLPEFDLNRPETAPPIETPDAKPEVERPDKKESDIERPALADAERPLREHPDPALPDRPPAIERGENIRADIDRAVAIERPVASERIEVPTPERVEPLRPDVGRPEWERPTGEVERPQLDRPVIEQPVVERPTIERPVPERADTERPEIERPEISVPDLARPDIERPAVERPALDRPNLERPNVERPDVERPNVERPDVERPNVERPDVERPTGIDRPEVARPDVERPDVERPDVQRPDLERPDVERPDIELPDIELPDIERPDVERPDVERRSRD